MKKYILFFAISLSMFSCIYPHKHLTIINNLQSLNIEIGNIDFFNYKLQSEFFNNNISHIVLTNNKLNFNGRGDLSVFNNLETYKQSSEYEGDYYDPHIPNDTLRYYYSKSNSKKLIDIKSDITNNGIYRFIYILDLSSPFVTIIATIVLNSFIIYFRSSCASQEIETYYPEYEKMLKSIRVKKIDKSDRYY